MRLKICLFLSMLACVALMLPWTGCSKDKATSTSSCDTSNLTYRNDILPIIKNYCFSCHSSATIAFSNNSAYNFEQGDSLGYSYFKGEAYIVLPVIRHDPGVPGMPYLQPMIPDCDINKIVAWYNHPIPIY